MLGEHDSKKQLIEKASQDQINAARKAQELTGEATINMPRSRDRSPRSDRDALDAAKIQSILMDGGDDDVMGGGSNADRHSIYGATGSACPT